MKKRMNGNPQIDGYSRTQIPSGHASIHVKNGSMQAESYRTEGGCCR